MIFCIDSFFSENSFFSYTDKESTSNLSNQDDQIDLAKLFLTSQGREKVFLWFWTHPLEVFFVFLFQHSVIVSIICSCFRKQGVSKIRHESTVLMEFCIAQQDTICSA